MLEEIKGKHILIDGDIVKYRCAASAEKTLWGILFEDGSFKALESYKDKKNYEVPGSTIWSRKEIQPLEFALQATKTCIDSLLAKLAPSKVSIFLSPARTFRDDLARTAPYKGNRNHVPKPKYLKQVEEYLIREHGAKVGVNVEADDEIGIALSRLGDMGLSVSIDKDLLQIPGWHYNWVSDTVRRVSRREADFAFYTQMLTGDITDNVPGITGIGERGAEKLLNGAKSSAELCARVWNVYRGEFNDTQKARDYFFEQAKLLYILREEQRHGAAGTWGYMPPIELK